MDLGIDGRGALVIGAGGGLGGAIAIALAAEGAKVACAGRDLASLERTVGAIEASGGSAVATRLDLGDRAGLGAAFKRAAEAIGGVDILVNNSGGPPPGAAADLDPDELARQFDSMVLGPIALTELALPGMRERGWGRIITNTSSGIVTPIANLATSNALRSSLLGWSKTLAGEVAGQGITANVLVPGRIATGRVEALDRARAEREARPVEEVAAASAATIPIGRYGDPAEYAAAAVFLASGPASYITGTTLRVDGGLIPSV
jgi:3-oxoacyl-[acyl-carrier protein] reductase